MVRHILFIDHANGLGGAEQSLLLILQHLDRAQWQPHLACTNGRLAQAAQSLNIPTHIIPLPRLRRSRHFSHDWHVGSSAISKLAKRIDAKILHTNTIRAAIYTAPAAQTARRPFIWHMRDFWLTENKPNRLWLDSLGKRLLTATSACVIANSAATATHLPASSKIKVVHNGIDLENFDPSLDKRPFRTKYQIPQDAPVIGMIGRLRPWKGQAHFLQMAAQITQARPDVYFLIVGGTTFGVDEIYPQQLKKMAEQLQISDRVVFTGQIDNIPQALAAMYIFVHPGDPEPFGLVNIEAMAMQKPVVAFAHGALPEIIMDGETGILVTPYDTDALATAVLSLLNNPQKQHMMGQNGRHRVETQFAIQYTVSQIESIYNNVLGYSQKA